MSVVAHSLTTPGEEKYDDVDGMAEACEGDLCVAATAWRRDTLSHLHFR